MTTAAPAVFTWRPDYSVGLPAMDNQHQALVRLINDLHVAMLGGKSKDVIVAAMADLIGCAEGHFASEETLMQQHKYVGLASHREDHKRLMRQAVELREKMREGRITLGMEVTQFLKSWLSNHLLLFDKAYAREFNRAAPRW